MLASLPMSPGERPRKAACGCWLSKLPVSRGHCRLEVWVEGGGSVASATRVVVQRDRHRETQGDPLPGQLPSRPRSGGAPALSRAEPTTRTCQLGLPSRAAGPRRATPFAHDGAAGGWAAEVIAEGIGVGEGRARVDLSARAVTSAIVAVTSRDAVCGGAQHSAVLSNERRALKPHDPPQGYAQPEASGSRCGVRECWKTQAAAHLRQALRPAQCTRQTTALS